MLAVRHHCHGQLHLVGVELGPGVQHIAFDEGDVPHYLIGVSLGEVFITDLVVIAKPWYKDSQLIEMKKNIRET